MSRILYLLAGMACVLAGIFPINGYSFEPAEHGDFLVDFLENNTFPLWALRVPRRVL